MPSLVITLSPSMRPWTQSVLTRVLSPPPSARVAFTPLWISSIRCLSHCLTTLPFLATGPLMSPTRSTTSLSLAAASLVPHFTLPLLSSLWHALSQPLSLPSSRRGKSKGAKGKLLVPDVKLKVSTSCVNISGSPASSNSCIT